MMVQSISTFHPHLLPNMAGGDITTAESDSYLAAS
jgi:hypothetical protein